MGTLILKTKSEKRLNLIQSLAVELGVTIERSLTKKRIVDDITSVSEKSLGESWNSKEDERWDELYKK